MTTWKDKALRYYLAKGIINIFYKKSIIDHHQWKKLLWSTYQFCWDKEIRKLTTGQGEDYTRW